jgi:hypothetical protein
VPITIKQLLQFTSINFITAILETLNTNGKIILQFTSINFITAVLETLYPPTPFFLIWKSKLWMKIKNFFWLLMADSTQE